MPNGSVLLAKNNQILRYDPKTEIGGNLIVSLSDREIQKVSGITVSPDGTKIAIAVEEFS